MPRRPGQPSGNSVWFSLTSIPEFEWDDDKAAANAGRPGRPPFDYAVRIFLDPGVVDFDVSHPGDGEVRRKAVGRIEGKVYVVVYTDRGAVRRIISARQASGTEVKAYGSNDIGSR